MFIEKVSQCLEKVENVLEIRRRKKGKCKSLFCLILGTCVAVSCSLMGGQGRAGIPYFMGMFEKLSFEFNSDI